MVYAVRMKFTVYQYGIFAGTTAMMVNRSLHPGGSHWHKHVCILTYKNISIHRRAELEILKILQDNIKVNYIISLLVICSDEMTQISSESLATIDIIFCRIQNNNTYMGGYLLIITLDHTQI